MMFDWLKDLARLRDANTPCVLITVTEARGSTPREAGVKMVVTAEEQFGTIGGGNLEFEAVAEARKLLVSSAMSVKTKNYPLGPTLAQCCGGNVTILLEPFIVPVATFFLFGAGHVGREVVRVLDGLPVKIIWIDERTQEFPADIPANCEKVVTARPLSRLAGLNDNSYVAVMTHDHALDFEIVKAALENGHFAYLGLIGSETKAARFRKRLAALGLDVSRLTCPIGLSAIKGKHPREIALSLAAELLSLGLSGTMHEEKDDAENNRARG